MRFTYSAAALSLVCSSEGLAVGNTVMGQRVTCPPTWVGVPAGVRQPPLGHIDPRAGPLTQAPR